MEAKKNNELEMFLAYYEKAKEEEVVNHEFNILNFEDTNDDKIKDFAQGKTIVYIEEYYNIHTPVFAYGTVAAMGAGVATGIAANVLLDGKVSDPIAVGAAIATSVGAAIVTEFAFFKANKIAREYDKNAKKAAEMTKAIKEHRKQDKSVLVDEIFITEKECVRIR